MGGRAPSPRFTAVKPSLISAAPGYEAKGYKILMSRRKEKLATNLFVHTKYFNLF